MRPSAGMWRMQYGRKHEHTTGMFAHRWKLRAQYAAGPSRYVTLCCMGSPPRADTDAGKSAVPERGARASTYAREVL
eukprot:12702641-Alexandrium_andersonii.AAC.1